MKYQKFMKKVMEQLAEYKGTVDTLATSYQLEVARREEELTGTKGKYTDEYIKESRQNWKPSKDYSGEISRSREKHQKIALAYIDQKGIGFIFSDSNWFWICRNRRSD